MVKKKPVDRDSIENILPEEEMTIMEKLDSFEGKTSANTLTEAKAVFLNSSGGIVSVALEGKDIVFVGNGKGAFAVKYRD